MTDRIEKTLDLSAPPARVWRALTDHREFGEWFRVNLETPFTAGAVSRGNITHCGYEHVTMTMRVRTMERERRFAFTWHPYAVDPRLNYLSQPETLVEFTLEPLAGGTRLRIVESGFDKLPSHRRDEAFRMNEGGWTAQVANIRQYLDAARAA